ncbi:hypothetical protein F2Q69_00059722 [Brassica cretica]|uniref:Uncharacterized protein n=1 Tax=Brassica cretica TaxID=69181 RepID=A0A8S9RDS2_BRACR|nr:hypothetical protein F2Q69_00059722 [Brassica cretica]
MEPCLGGCGIVSSVQGRLRPLSLGHTIGILPRSLGFREIPSCPSCQRQDPDPGAGTWKLDGGTRDLEAGTWKPEARAGNNMVFFIGLRELHRCIKFLVEFGVGRRLVAWALKLSCRQDFSLHFLRPSGSMNRVEECMGQEPGILRGRILARLRIRGMRRFNKTRRPKLRILMLDPAGLACAS